MKFLLSFDKFFWLIIISSLLLHIVLAFLPGLTFDITYWFNWSERLQQVGFINFYTPAERTDYLPGYLYILYILGVIKNYFQLDNDTYSYLLKLPGILSEILLISTVYLILLKVRNIKVARLGLLLVAFNPALIFNSSIWGQIDSLLTLFLLLTVISLNTKRTILTAIFFGVSTLIKPQALLLLPVFFLNLVYNPSVWRFIKFFLTTSIVIMIFSLPFFGSSIIPSFFSHLINTANEYPYNSLSAYNLWGILGFWINDSQVFLGITYYQWGAFLYLIFWLIVIILIKKNYNLFVITSLSALSFYFLPTRVHERYLYPAIIFLLLSSFVVKKRILIILTIILSILHFINLLQVYLQYNGHLLTFMSYINPVYQFFGKNTTLLSILSVILFVLISKILLTNHVKTNS